MTEPHAAAWLTVLGQRDSALEAELERRVQARVSAGEFSFDNVQYIAKMHLNLAERALDVDDVTLEKLRRLCQLWDVDLRVREITSHRKLIGPLIVAGKKLFYPVLRAFFRDFIRQQRSFNAAAIALMADIANRSGAAGKR